LKTSGTPNKQNNYTLNNPFIIKNNKLIVRNYALILLKVYQDYINGYNSGYNRKQLIQDSIGKISDKHLQWNWTNRALCNEFATFNYNNLLTYNKKERKWYPGIDLIKYIEYHFQNTELSEIVPFNDAIELIKQG